MGKSNSKKATLALPNSDFLNYKWQWRALQITLAFVAAIAVLHLLLQFRCKAS